MRARAAAGDVAFQVQSGDTPATIGARLQKLGLIQDSDLFRQVVKARGVEARLEAGDYVLRRGMNMDEILVSLQHCVVRPNTVRVIEGLRIEEIGAMLERQGVVSSANFRRSREGRTLHDTRTKGPASRIFTGRVFIPRYLSDPARC